MLDKIVTKLREPSTVSGLLMLLGLLGLSIPEGVVQAAASFIAAAAGLYEVVRHEPPHAKPEAGE